MTLRAKLTVWFIVSAMFPAVVITVFAAGEAARRFGVRAMEELAEAEAKGEDELERIKKEIETKLSTIAGSDTFEQFISTLEDTEGTAPDPYFAESVNDEFNLGLDFLSFFGECRKLPSAMPLF